MSASGQARIRVMRFILLFSILLLIIKFIAWWITHSNAILTDALESIVNVTAGAFALFSIWYAARPSDEDHPYGHGKIEFISAGFEGALILLAGGAILYRAVRGFWFPQEIHQPDIGAILTAVAGGCNFLMGNYLLRRGKREFSALMKASGHHLISDTLSSIGLVLGMIIIHFTGKVWIDNALALAFGLYIVFTGIKLVREAMSGLLDEADTVKLGQVINSLQQNRRARWIDVHKLRVQKYGTQLHIDAHLTLPWYLPLEEAHAEVEAMEHLVNNSMGEEVEFFIHADPCIPTSCPVCAVANCDYRKAEQSRQVTWSISNVLPDSKHRQDTA